MWRVEIHALKNGVAARNRPDSPRSPREALAVGCYAAHTDASSPQQRCRDRIHHPLKSIPAQGDWLEPAVLYSGPLDDAGMCRIAR
jgi:hypothetical protein